jgi:hypothetical protein
MIIIDININRHIYLNLLIYTQNNREEGCLRFSFLKETKTKKNETFLLSYRSM